MEEILTLVMSEYGVFTGALIIALGKVYSEKKALEIRNQELTDKILEVVQGNTAALTELNIKLDVQKLPYGGRNVQ